MNRSASAPVPIPDSETLQQEARVWVRTLASGEVTNWQADAFRRWIGASAQHKCAFRAAKARWDALQPAVGEMLRTNPEAAAMHRQTLQRARPQAGRRAFLGAAATAAGVAGLALVHPQVALMMSTAAGGADLRTGTGEQQAVTLADDVRIVLNTQTRVRHLPQGGAVQGSAGIDLLAGEALIDLPQGSRAFAVAAGAGRSTAEGGSFEVRNLAGKVCVTCIDGSVRVSHAAGTHVLAPGQQTVYDERTLSGVGRVALADVAAWRRGELVFNKTRLALVIDEINRYRAGHVLLANDSVRNKAVSGRFVIKALDAALAQIQHNYDLSARTLPGGWLILS